MKDIHRLDSELGELLKLKEQLESKIGDLKEFLELWETFEEGVFKYLDVEHRNFERITTKVEWDMFLDGEKESDCIYNFYIGDELRALQKQLKSVNSTLQDVQSDVRKIGGVYHD